MSEDLIVVLGATGKTGRRVSAALRAAGHRVRAASRSSAARFDWTDPSTWDDVLDGVSAVYVVAPAVPGPAHEFVPRAVAAGARRFVLLSGRGADTWGDSPFGLDMRSAEDAVRASGVGWSILRAPNFNQNFDEDLFHAPIMAGELALPADGITEPFIDADDIADVAVTLLTAPGHTDGVYELSGPRALTFREAVERIARASGRPVRYRDVTPEEYVAVLVAQGFPVEDAEYLRQMFDLMRTGATAEVTDAVHRVLGRPPRDFESYVARAAAAGAWR
ncbi:NAD(P)H-binding protein [Micromonospora coxensis]|uniref:NmrA family NAD(P)-binding protein n=1 Tax=Micromonospora coxensis TaxID=356852 RepID=UPI003433BCBD